MVWLVVVGVLGLVLGWLARSFTAPRRRDLVEFDERAQRAERRLRSVVVERDNEHATVRTLRAALGSERQLLDGVAHQAGVEPELFRKTISREYLGRELVVSPASLVDVDFGSSAATEAATELASLRRQLEAKDAQLAEASEQIQRIRSDVESLAMAGAPRRDRVPSSSRGIASGPLERRSQATLDVRSDEAVIDLCEPSSVPPAPRRLAASTEANDHLRFLENRAASARMLEAEVTELRARLADTTIANDDMRRRIEYRRSLDAQLAGIIAELESFRERVVAEKPQAVPDEDPDALL